MKMAISAGTPIPCRREELLATTAENQSSMNVTWHEKTSDNEGSSTLLADASLDGLPIGAAGTVMVKVITEISKAGILKVQLLNESTGKEVGASAK